MRLGDILEGTAAAKSEMERAAYRRKRADAKAAKKRRRDEMSAAKGRGQLVVYDPQRARP